eukprot:TRINITY_DN22135_c0_g1_i1.p1 TRINITY_DN22135_c0_g1~~TRINITY_DN22135_c0_g1_i1.p1  ORF type:complete len:1300 (-),score=303.89 TRINITY_DN22135_c0_g1_i1:251-4150(-)
MDLGVIPNSAGLCSLSTSLSGKETENNIIRLSQEAVRLGKFSSTYLTSFHGNNGIGLKTISARHSKGNFSRVAKIRSSAGEEPPPFGNTQEGTERAGFEGPQSGLQSSESHTLNGIARSDSTPERTSGSGMDAAGPAQAPVQAAEVETEPRKAAREDVADLGSGFKKRGVEVRSRSRWNPYDDWISRRDGYGGWTMPLELEKLKTDIHVVAGLPEVSSAVLFFLGITVFGFTALQKREVLDIRLLPNNNAASAASAKPFEHDRDAAVSQKHHVLPAQSSQQELLSPALGHGAVGTDGKPMMTSSELQTLAANSSVSSSHANLLSEKASEGLQASHQQGLQNLQKSHNSPRDAEQGSAQGPEQNLKQGSEQGFGTEGLSEGSGEQGEEELDFNQLVVPWAETLEGSESTGDTEEGSWSVLIELDEDADQKGSVEGGEGGITIAPPTASRTSKSTPGTTPGSNSGSASSSGTPLGTTKASTAVAPSSPLLTLPMAAATATGAAESATARETTAAGGKALGIREGEEAPLGTGGVILVEEGGRLIMENSLAVSPPAPVSATADTRGSGGVAGGDRVGRVVVPAAVDHAQAMAFEVLQARKVVEKDVDPAGICSRREYARWVVTASTVLSRRPGDRIFPSMFVEGLTDLAFEDVLPSDPDFPYIQGLAEAGLISSQLSRQDIGCGQNPQLLGCSDAAGATFHPDSPLTRQDLISWKVALDQMWLPSADVQAVKKLSSYMDADRIDKDALPAVAYDLAAGEKSIILSSFGYTRRFEPLKPVTHAQAACALALGQAAEVVAEELLRLEFEQMADAAVEAADEADAESEREAAAHEKLQAERLKREEAEEKAEEARQQLRMEQQARELEKEALTRTQAEVATERRLLKDLNRQLEEQIAGLQGVEGERRALEKLRSAAEAEKAAAAEMKGEAEVEKKAFALARAWAEEEAARAREEFARLEAARQQLASSQSATATSRDAGGTLSEASPSGEQLASPVSAVEGNDGAGFADVWGAIAKAEDVWRETGRAANRSFEAVASVGGKAFHELEGLVKGLGNAGKRGGEGSAGEHGDVAHSSGDVGVGGGSEQQDGSDGTSALSGEGRGDGGGAQGEHTGGEGGETPKTSRDTLGEAGLDTAEEKRGEADGSRMGSVISGASDSNRNQNGGKGHADFSSQQGETNGVAATEVANRISDDNGSTNSSNGAFDGSPTGLKGSNEAVNSGNGALNEVVAVTQDHENGEAGLLKVGEKGTRGEGRQRIEQEARSAAAGVKAAVAETASSVSERGKHLVKGVVEQVGKWTKGGKQG